MPQLLDAFNTLHDGLSSTAQKNVVVKSETLNKVLCCAFFFFSISLLLFDCWLTAIQDKDSSSGDRKDVIIKLEVIETEMMSGIDMSFDSNYLWLNHYTHLIR